MKKSILTVAALAMVPFFLAACSSNSSKQSESNSASESSSSKKANTSSDQLKSNLSRSSRTSMANSTTHKINWKGGVYTSKYSLKQMQQKFNVHYYKTKESPKVSWYHNEYMGLTTGANIKNQAHGVKSTQGKVNSQTDYYAAFFTYNTKQKFQSKKYVNLNDGSFYVQRFQ